MEDVFSQREEKVTNDDLLDMLLSNDEIDWKSFIRDLVRTEQMDPWDINVTKISNKFLDLVKDLQEMDFRLSGKMILATSFFLKIKSDKLLGDDIEAFDAMIVEDDFEEFEDMEEEFEEVPEPTLVPRSPQPRKRKVSISDLAHALESALKKEKKKQIRSIQRQQQTEKMKEEQDISPKEKKKDIDVIIEEVFTKVKNLFSKKPKVNFTHLLSSQEKQHKVETFIPLLHLDNQGRVALIQEKHFGDIHVNVEDEQ